jgi:hypothetical protein
MRGASISMTATTTTTIRTITTMSDASGVGNPSLNTYERERI